MRDTKSNLQTGKASYSQDTRVRRYLFPSSNEGLTLIELLVVIVIVGILAAISFPALTNQIGKSRETEATTQLGTIARAQQAYHYEKGSFAGSLDLLAINGSFNSKYYNYPVPVLILFPGGSAVKHRAEPIQPIKDRIRNYATGVYFDTGVYEIILCQGNEIGDTVDAPNDRSGVCSNGGNQIE